MCPFVSFKAGGRFDVKTIARQSWSCWINLHCCSSCISRGLCFASSLSVRTMKFHVVAESCNCTILVKWGKKAAWMKFLGWNMQQFFLWWTMWWKNVFWVNTMSLIAVPDSQMTSARPHEGCCTWPFHMMSWFLLSDWVRLCCHSALSAAMSQTC